MKIIEKINKKAATIEGDLPARIIHEFSEELSVPLSNLISSCLGGCVYPNLWKIEYVTPVPKIYPPERLTDLRKISGLLHFSKIADKVIAELLAEDMSDKRDKSEETINTTLSNQDA